MAEHGYARYYDEPTRRGDDEPRSRRGEVPDRGRRGRDEGWDEQRDRSGGNFMLGERRRGWPAGSARGREGGGYFRDMSRGRISYDQEGRRSPRDFSSDQDDHYLSWRNRQMEALDRDYADYCREREQQFHRDFDHWRESRQSRKENSMSPEEVLELDNPARLTTEPESGPSPVGEATLGTNNSENVAPGRR